MSGGEERAVRVVISGQVQGVGFRAWVKGRAELHGLSGWVRNRRDGTVEAVFKGPRRSLDPMLKACREGPRTARIEGVDKSPAQPDDLSPAGEGFGIRPTA